MSTESVRTFTVQIDDDELEWLRLKSEADLMSAVFGYDITPERLKEAKESLADPGSWEPWERELMARLGWME
jgi:hypothetical protein